MYQGLVEDSAAAVLLQRPAAYQLAAGRSKMTMMQPRRPDTQNAVYITKR